MQEGSTLESGFANALWHHRLLVVGVVLVSVGLALVVALSRPPEYTATASLILSEPRASQIFGEAGARAAQRNAANQIAILRSPSVANKAEAFARSAQPPLRLSRSDFLGATITGSAEESDLVKVRFTARTPSDAVRGANLLLDAFQDVRRSAVSSNAASALAELEATLQSVNAELAASQAALVAPQSAPEFQARSLHHGKVVERQAALLQKRDEIRVNSELERSSVALVTPADKAALSSRPAQFKIIAMGVVLGALVATALACFLTFVRRRFSQSYEPELVLGAPLLAQIPLFSRETGGSALPIRTHPESRDAEAFRFVVTSLEARRQADGGNSFAIVSATPEDGKSTVAANATWALAEAGSRVAVIDGDLDGQGVTHLLLDGVTPKTGWIDIIEGKAELRDVLTKVPGQHVYVLSPGRLPSSVPEFLRSRASGRLFDRLFNELEANFDVVVVDTPALLAAASAATFVRHAKHTVVVVTHRGSFPRLEEATRQLRLLGTSVAGYVYNRSPRRPVAPSSLPAATKSRASTVPPSAQPASLAANVTPQGTQGG